MEKEDKKRDPMPPPDATPEEIGEFWDTHSLTDYWDETQEVQVQVDLKSDQNEAQSDQTESNLSVSVVDESKAALEVVPEDTAGNALEVVTNFISGLNPSTWVARNAFKAFGKLCSAPKGWYDAYFEGKAAETRARSDARVKIISEGTDQITQQMNVPVEYAQIALNKEMEKLIGERLNLDITCAIAANELKKEQSDNSTNQGANELNKEQPADSSNQGANSSDGKAIDDDWINGFETEARQKSTEEMQLRFGRILAGEIRQPGSYSIKAVKLLGELDQNTAILFKKFCSVCVAIGVLGIPNSEQVLDARVLSLGGSLGSNALRKYGLGLDQLNILKEYSLITSSDISLHDYNLCIVYEANPVPSPFRHQGKFWALLPSSDRDNTPEFKLSGIGLSRVGRELFRIVDQDPMPEYTKDLKKYFADQKLQMVEVPMSQSRS